MKNEPNCPDCNHCMPTIDGGCNVIAHGCVFDPVVKRSTNVKQVTEPVEGSPTPPKAPRTEPELPSTEPATVQGTLLRAAAETDPGAEEAVQKTCQVTLKSGKHIGDPCGRPVKDNTLFCHFHTKRT